MQNICRTFVFLFAVLFAHPILAQLTSSPLSVVFSGAKVGSTVGQSIQLDRSQSGEVTIKELRFSDPAFSTTQSVPFVVNYPVKVLINFKPTVSKLYNETLEIYSNTALLLTIPLIGDVSCWTVDCEPKGPICVIDKTVQPYQPFLVPSFFSLVAPAINKHVIAHSSGTDYDLPVDFILKYTGLSGQLSVTPKADCDFLHFKHLPKSRLRARFARDATAVDITATGTVSSYTIKIIIPKTISGVAVVGGGYSELHFDQHHEPTLIIQYQNSDIFTGPIKCMNVTYSSSTIFPANPTLTLPNLPLEVK